MNKKLLTMATLAFLSMGSLFAKKAETPAPITKPHITLSDDRLTPEALWAMGRIGSATIQPGGHMLAYTVSYYSVQENRSTTWIKIANVHISNDGEGEAHLDIVDEFVGSEPAWYDEHTLAYLRKGQLYLRPVGSKGKERRVQEAGNDIEGFLYSPNHEHLVTIRQVHTRDAQPHSDLDKTSGRVIEDLMYKHWDEWTETAPHPFLDGKDILAGTAYESPMKPFGGIEQLAFSPDSKTLAYTCRKKTGLDYAISTNSDIYLYDIATGQETNITEGNGGYDTNPAFSQDGHYIAWLSMERDGYESDQNRLMVKDLQSGEIHFVSRALDTNVDTYYWDNNHEIVFSAVWHATANLYRVNIETQQITTLLSGQYDHEPVGAIDSNLVYLRHSMCQANELYLTLQSNNQTYNLTHENDNIYSQVTMGHVEPRWQTTTDGQQMLTWIIYPPHFDPNKKYPTLLYCEGGPQSPVSQFWSFRWNFMMMAAADYIVVAPNRRGLPGFGMAWNEQISGDYGGQCMRDYFTAIDEVCDQLPYVDRNRLGAVGASFGGYSVYWIAGHHEGRFKAFIAHDGIFNMEMQYLETEEKWFANWDMGGAYWEHDNAIAQRTFANSPHRFVDRWDTPILCIHGEKDYRILANQAMAAFDAAKLRGVSAQLLIFPDENHWVLQPQNGILWQRTFREWLDRWLKR